MASIKELSPAKCLVLAATAASEANVESLQAIYTSRPDVFNIELSLRILLSFLPESLESSSYSTLVAALGNDDVTQTAPSASKEDSAGEVDVSAVTSIDEKGARRMVKRELHLLPLRHASVSPSATIDPLSQFLIHRTYLLDANAGLLSSAVDLFQPYIDRSEYLRWWYLTTVLPLVRHNDLDSDHALTLKEFDELEGSRGATLLIEGAERSATSTDSGNIEYGYRLREIAGPWTYGSSLRKRRKLVSTNEANHSRELSADALDVEQCWEFTFEWMVSSAIQSLQKPLEAIDNWDGPVDVDFSLGASVAPDAIFNDQQKRHLRERYCQVAVACVYACEEDSQGNIAKAHAVLVRLSDLLELDPPLELEAGIDLLIDMANASPPSEAVLRSSLQPGSLLDPDNALTTPTPFNYSLLQYYVSAAFLLAKLGYATSISRAARLPLLDSAEQLELFKKIINTLLQRSRRQEISWASCRSALHALRGARPDTPKEPNAESLSLFNRVSTEALEQEFLKALCAASAYSLVKSIYLSGSHEQSRPLADAIVERTLIRQAYEYYDGASNGNKTRGAIKKAADILSEFNAFFPQSKGFRQLAALISATHAISYYSLILQPGIPFKPVGIRASGDPVSLVEKILDQNANSYTKLDDLIQIGRNLAITIEPDPSKPASQNESEGARQELAEHRVMEMVIRAALAADDFETAYSYITNRLGSAQARPPSTLDAGDNTAAELSVSDDFAWRAAFEAGRHRTPAKGNANPLRRPQQRMELLSSALLLAPPAKLPDILAAWRRCEEELLTLLAQEQAAEAALDESADRRSAMPGGFGGIEMVQPRRTEMGRGAAEEAPMGLFDVARGAAAAFGRNAGSIRGGHHKNRASAASAAGSRVSAHGDEMTVDADGNRVRKRDMVANAVTGGLVSGIGWVLGAKPQQ